MFETGEVYVLVLEDGDGYQKELRGCRLIDFADGLIKVEHGDKIIIVNTASNRFLYAWRPKSEN